MQEEVHQQIRTNRGNTLRWHRAVLVLMVLILRWYIVDPVNVYQLVVVKAELVDTVSQVYMPL